MFLKLHAGVSTEQQRRTLCPVSLASECSRVLIVRSGISLPRSFQVNPGNALRNWCVSAMMRSRLRSFTIVGSMRTIFHRHWAPYTPSIIDTEHNVHHLSPTLCTMYTIYHRHWAPYTPSIIDTEHHVHHLSPTLSTIYTIYHRLSDPTVSFKG